MAPDNWGSKAETKQRYWFYFKVTPMLSLKQGKSRVVTFTLKNQSINQKRSYSKGMVPVYKSIPGSPEWKYIPKKLKKLLVKKGYLEVSFQFSFTERDDHVYFAYSFPYSYTECIQRIDAFSKEISNSKEVYFHRELMTPSLGMRRIDLLTITGMNSYLKEDTPKFKKEPLLEGLFPFARLGAQEQNISTSVDSKLFHRPPIFPHKKYVLISARVHAGESPSSYILEGFLKKLLDKNDAESKVLLQNFVFVIIPMINPDGVAQGNSRFDLRARDPNGVYVNPKLKDEPGQYGIIQLAKEFGKEKRLWMYIDLHAHCNRDSAFVFGTWSEGLEQQLNSFSFIRILDIYSQYFDYEESSWNHHNFPDGVAKNAVMYYSKCPHSYTLETSYYKGLKDSERYKKYTIQDLRIRYQLRCQKNGWKYIMPYIPPETVDWEYYFPKTSYLLSYKNFEEIGVKITSSILDVEDLHPNSILHKTCFKDVAGVFEYQRNALLQYNGLSEDQSKKSHDEPNTSESEDKGKLSDDLIIMQDEFGLKDQTNLGVCNFMEVFDPFYTNAVSCN